MGGANSWRTPQDAADWMREVEKRILHEERRPNIRTASDLMGPGVGPYSVWINDWNADETNFNGFFHSDPGALNTPDNTKCWMGTTQATPEGYGLMRVTEYRDGNSNIWPRYTYIRKFFTPPGAQRQFSAWRLDDGTPPGIITEYGGASVAPNTYSTASDASAWAPASGWTITRQETRRVDDGMLWVDVEGSRTGAAIVRNASGDNSNVLVATLTTRYSLSAQQCGLTSGQQGRAAHFNVYASSRQCSLTSFGGTTDYAVGEDYSFGGALPVVPVAQDTPVGVAPNGWYYCNGAVKNRSDFPELFAAIGTRWNTTGESGSQFRLPNLPGKVIKA
jgi:hypothetical protein